MGLSPLERDCDKGIAAQNGSEETDCVLRC